MSGDKMKPMRLLIVILSVIGIFAAAMVCSMEAVHAADVYVLARPTDHYIETAGGIIYEERVWSDNYLFLPNEADATNIVLHTGKPDSKAFFIVDNEECGSLDLGKLRASGNVYSVDVVIRDAGGNKTNSYQLKILKGSGIGTVYFNSDDPDGYGRAWVEKTKGNRSSGHAVVFDANGNNLTEDAKNQVVEDIHGRGATSWGALKKGYQIKFDKKISLVDGAAKEKKWVLLAQYKDALRMNDIICKKIAEATRTDFTPKATWVNFYYDGEYRGLYELTEKNDIKSGRININNPEDEYEDQDPDYGNHTELNTALNDYQYGFRYQEGLVGPEEPGGFLMEINEFEFDEYNGFYFGTSINWQAANIKVPELGSKEFVKYVSEYFHEFSMALTALDENGEHTGRNPVTGKYYYEYCDIDSLVDTYLIQCLSSNYDAFARSQFFYKDRGGIMVSGPVWDMDLTFGFGWNEELSPDLDYLEDRWFTRDLIKIKEFRRRLCRRYREIYSKIMDSLISTGELVPSLKQNYTLIKSDLVMDHILWPSRYKSAGGNLQWPASTSYTTIVNNRIDWISRHKEFLDEYFRKMAEDEEEEHAYENSYRDNGDDTHTAECVYCGYVETSEHEFDNGAVITKADPENEGLRKYVCVKCGAVKQEAIPSVQAAEITINKKTVKATDVKNILAAVDTEEKTTDVIILGKKVRKIKAGSFAKTDVRTITVKTKYLKSAFVKSSLKGSSVKAVKVKIGSRKTNRKYVKKYKKIFTKKNTGRKVIVS